MRVSYETLYGSSIYKLTTKEAVALSDPIMYGDFVIVMYVY